MTEAEQLEKLRQAFENELRQLERAEAELSAIDATTDQIETNRRLDAAASRLANVLVTAIDVPTLGRLSEAKDKATHIERILQDKEADPSITTVGPTEVVAYRALLGALLALRIQFGSQLRQEILSNLKPTVDSTFGRNIDAGTVEPGESFAELNNPNLEELVANFPDWSVVEKNDPNLFTPIDAVKNYEGKKDTLQLRLRKLAANVQSGRQLTNEEITELQGVLAELRQDTFTYQAPSRAEVLKQIFRIMTAIRTILRRDRANQLQTTDNAEKYLPPQETDSAIFMDFRKLLREIGEQDLERVEALGALVARARDKSTVLDSSQREQIRRLLSKFEQKDALYTAIFRANPQLDPTVRTRLIAFVREIRNYTRWLNDLLDETEEATTPATGRLPAADTDRPRVDTLEGWSEYVDSCVTFEELKDLIRKLINKNNRPGKGFTKLSEASSGQGRFENQVYERWKDRCRKLAREKSDPEYLALLDRYERTVRLFDFDIPNGNSRTRATNYKDEAVRKEITMDEVAKTFTHQDVYYFLIPEQKIYVTDKNGNYLGEDGKPIRTDGNPLTPEQRERRVPRYPGKIDRHFEHSETVRKLCWFMMQLDSQHPDPAEDPAKDRMPVERRRGRYYGYNYVNDANAKTRMKEEMKEACRRMGIKDDKEAEELVEITFALMTALNIGMKKAFMTRLQAISPRQNEDAVMKEQIQQLFPEAAGCYSCQKHEKAIEYALYIDFSEAIRDAMEKGVALNASDRNTEVNVYLENLKESFDNTRTFWEAYNGPLRDDPYIIDFVPGTRLVRTPFPDMIQVFLVGVDDSFDKYRTMNTFFSALDGHEKFQKLLTANIKLPKGISSEEAQRQLISKLEELFGTFSLIKNLSGEGVGSVDWGYYARCVVHFIDKMYFAYTHHKMEGTHPSPSDPVMSPIESQEFAAKILEEIGILIDRLKLRKQVVAAITGGHVEASYFAGAMLSAKTGRMVDDTDEYGARIQRPETLFDYYKRVLDNDSPAETRRRRPYRRYRVKWARTAAAILARKRVSGGDRKRHSAELIGIASPDFMETFEKIEFGSGDSIFKDSQGKEPT